MRYHVIWAYTCQQVNEVNNLLDAGRGRVTTGAAAVVQMIQLRIARFVEWHLPHTVGRWLVH